MRDVSRVLSGLRSDGAASLVARTLLALTIVYAPVCAYVLTLTH